MKKLILLILSATISLLCQAQDLNYAKKIIDVLSSEAFYGRGYVNKGDSIAAVFLKKEYENIGLKNFGNSYFQEYSISVNTISEDPVLIFGDEKLVPAKQFVVIPNSPDIDGWVKICWINNNTLTNYWAFNHFYKMDKSDCLICIDTSVMNNADLYKFANLVFSKEFVKSKGIIEATQSLKYTARTYIGDYIHLQVKPEFISSEIDSVYVKISNTFFDEYKTNNIIGYLQGKSDSTIMITAHYDHLGMLGNTIFPGANDNASGVSMVLNLAKYYKEYSGDLKHTLVFVLFSGEEAGLLGSKHLADNTPFNLEKVKALINFDMVGTGEAGFAVFNAKEYPEYERLINEINDEEKYFDNIRTSFAVSSSDHAPFHDKGVKAMFFYTSGSINNYHQPEDLPRDLSFHSYNNVFRIVIDFISKL